MRCLHCRYDGISLGDISCPGCGAHLPFLMRDVLLPGTRLNDGKYLLDYALGRGGFGITYRAFHVELQRNVAIKEFFPQEHAMRDGTSGQLSIPTTQQGNYKRALERFMEEGRILSQLEHPNVVHVYDSFRELNTAYIVMALLDGGTLRDRLDKAPNKRLPPTEVRAITDNLVDALEIIHSQNIYHLDISPDNVQLTSSGRIVLIDFGAARHNLTSGTTRAFKLAYAAPEVLSGNNIGPQSDLFELAMMLHEMLTGKLPPSVLERMAGTIWKADGLEDPWRRLLSSALYMEKDARPPTVREWWNCYHKPRGSVILGGAKKRQIKLPEMSGGRPVKPGRGTPAHKKGANQALFGAHLKGRAEKGRGNRLRIGGLPAKSRRVLPLLNYIGCIILSCVLGLLSYYIIFELLKPKGSLSEPSYNTDYSAWVMQQTEYNRQYRTAELLGIVTFCVVSLGSFILSAIRLWNSSRAASRVGG